MGWPAKVLFYLLLGSVVLVQLADAAPAQTTGTSSSKSKTSSTSTKTSTSSSTTSKPASRNSSFHFVAMTGSSTRTGTTSSSSSTSIGTGIKPTSTSNSTSTSTNPGPTGAGNNSTTAKPVFKAVKVKSGLISFVLAQLISYQQACSINSKTSNNKTTTSTNTTSIAKRRFESFSRYTLRSNNAFTAEADEEFVGAIAASSQIARQLEQGHFDGDIAEELDLGKAVYLDEAKTKSSALAKTRPEYEVCLFFVKKDIWKDDIAKLWFTDKSWNRMDLVGVGSSQSEKEKLEDNRNQFARANGIVDALTYARFAARDPPFSDQVAIPADLLVHGFRVVCFKPGDGSGGAPADLSYKAKAQELSIYHTVYGDQLSTAGSITLPLYRTLDPIVINRRGGWWTRRNSAEKLQSRVLRNTIDITNTTAIIPPIKLTTPSPPCALAMSASNSGPVIEIVKLPANELMDGKPELYQECLKTLSEQSGLKNQWYAGAIEDPKIYHSFIEWDTHSSHLSFINSPVYTPFGDKLKALLAQPWAFCHVSLDPAKTNVLVGPVVSFRTVTLKEGVDRAKAIEAFEAVVDVVRAFDKCHGAAWGFTMEDENKAVFVVSWESREAHMEEFSNTEAAKKVGPAFGSVVGASENWHMHIKHYEPPK
ncbi:hypothetical protein D9758_013450 [Tetrapyrgos nigripes]|uniref:ABM domain-containing protein n=1 Tax=Tetrapyrgos nigripes TaxID=182062 RepID=A0A8H5CRB9_9AGAR|nr:hypothetical protein D9758_013450 [Tetrapyrgos nigripes]